MYTQCTECDTILPLSAGELAVAHGQVRCGSCGAVFSALDALCHELDVDGHVRTCFHSERPPTLSDPRAGDSLIDDLFLSQPPAALEMPAPAEEPVPPVPSELRPRPPSARPRALAWGAGTVLLLLGLFAQMGWANRERLARSPELRPWMERACAAIGCRPPLANDLSQIRLVGRNIRPHPSVAGALIISAAMQNQAPYPQPYPTVEITLSDLHGRTVAMRRFQPPEYLDEGASPEDGMPPMTLLPLVFEVVDPGEDAVAFEFTFR